MPTSFAYNVVFALPGAIGPSGTPAGTVLPVETFPDTVNFPQNFLNSIGSAGTNPTSNATFTILQNGATVGNAVIAPTGVVTFASSGGFVVSFVRGDRLTIQVPTVADATLADVAITLYGLITP